MNNNQNKTDIRGEVMGKQANMQACPICGDRKSERKLCVVDDYDIYSCDNCGVDYVFPVPDDAALKAYYDRKDCVEGGMNGGNQDYDAQTAWSLSLFRSALDAFENQKGLSILDIGCGYGTHLSIAAEQGWKCFGVELSEHARVVAKSRLGNAAYIVESVSDLIPHEFDLILMFDVIEHLYSPYSLFYSLFSIGAITKKTRIVITTPNAGPLGARRDPEGWIYRHPPSHLIYYTAESLSFVLKRLQFPEIDIEGIHPIAGSELVGSMASCAGLLVNASGSNFTEFMRERYVPGTWSKIAEYEHMPRYLLAQTLAANKEVLDFGCGTGYGAAMLAEVAASVIGLDIDPVAQNWARECHRNSRLNFHQCDDLGTTLASESFDLVTCFEMIEHIDHAAQRATISNIARLLRDDGILLISTPNPEVTKLYGDNPYHLREMTEGEFLELLTDHFSHITLIKQKVRISISFDGSASDEDLQTVHMNPSHRSDQVAPLAFIAICSKGRETGIPSFISFDDTDYILDFMRRESKLHQASFEAYRLSEQVHDYRVQAEEFSRQVTSLQNELISAQQYQNELISAQQYFARELDELRIKYFEELNNARFLSRKLVGLISIKLQKFFSGKSI